MPTPADRHFSCCDPSPLCERHSKRLDEVYEIVTEIRTEQKQLAALLREHHRVLFGQDNESAPGLRITVDRLVQLDKRRLWLLGTVLTAVVGLLCKAIIDLLEYRLHPHA